MIFVFFKYFHWIRMIFELKFKVNLENFRTTY